MSNKSKTWNNAVIILTHQSWSQGQGIKKSKAKKKKKAKRKEKMLISDLCLAWGIGKWERNKIWQSVCLLFLNQETHEPDERIN